MQPESLINQLDAERHRQSLSIVDLAARLGWDKGSLRHKLTGRRGTDATELVAIAGALGLAVELRPAKNGKRGRVHSDNRSA